MRLRGRAAAALAAVATALAGCGGDGEATKDFARDANRVCDRMFTDLRGWGESQAAVTPDRRDFAAAARILGRGREDMRRLEPPDDDDAQRLAATFERAVDGFLAALRDARAAQAAGDTDALTRALHRFQAVDTQAVQEVARRVGAPDCS